MRSSTASRRPRTGNRGAADRKAFEPIRKIGLTLPEVELGTAYGAPALKVRGQMFACMTTHSSSEPGSLAIRMPFADRDELLANDPDVYYLTPHYEPYPCIVVRLSRVHKDALKDLLWMGLRFVSAKTRRRPRASKPRRRNT
jgi:hypothetical protein